MGKVVPTRRPAVSQPVEKDTKPLIPEKYQNAVYISLLFIAVFVFFWGAISKGGFNEFDNISSMSFKNYLKQANDSGHFPLWIPYIFSGMPSFAALLVTGLRSWDFLARIVFGISELVGGIFSNDTARVVFWYFIYGLGVYLLMLSKKMEKYVAFFAALAAMFSTWVITWIMIGHNTKPVVFAIIPFIFLCLERLRVKFSILWTALLIIAVHIMMEGGHLQMIFYAICAFGIYLVYELISRAVRKEQPLNVVRAAVLLALAGGLAFLMSADRYLSTMEYTPYSTRGSAPIEKVKGNTQDASGGNDYDYATMWSYSPGETFTFLNPSYFGFGTRDYQTGKAPTYWGQKESEDSPPYMGIGVFALAIIGFILFRRDPFVQFLLVLGVFAVFLSFGKNMPILYDIFYNTIPSFNKFRAPSMSLALLHFAVPLLSGYGLSRIINMRKNATAKDKKLLIGFIVASGAYLLIGVFFSASMQTSYFSAVESSRYYQMMAGNYGAGVAEELKNFIWSNMMEDWYVTAFILIAFAALSYFFVRRTINRSIYFVALIALLIFDLWRVDYRREEISPEKAENSVLNQNEDAFNFIKQDKGVYRVADFASSPANISAYYLVENINGYHAAKLRIYQDLMDVANMEGAQGSTSQVFNPFLWNLLNVKYILSSRPFGNMPPAYRSQTTGTLVYTNPAMLPRVFFVKNAVVAKQMDILQHLKKGDFNPLDTAFVESALPQSIDAPDQSATAQVLSHENEYVKLEANASGNNLLFISEIYYPVRWHAYIDGKEVSIQKTNFTFRSVIVPKGKHTVEMRFRSEKFETGRTLSLVSNIGVTILLAVGIFLTVKSRKKIEDAE